MRTRTWLLSALVCLSSLISGCSSGGSNSSSPAPTPTPTPAVTPPTVTAISPAMVGAGAPATTVTITGTNFLSTTAIQIAGIVESTTFISSTQISSVVPASQLASAALLNVIASNGSSSSASGTAVNLEVDNPVPAITQFVPSAFATGAAGSTLAITGTGFVPTTTLQVNGTARSAAFISATQINVVLTSADLATAGSLSIVAVNAAPGGGTSAAASVPINNPAPGPIMLTPSTLPAGGAAAATITVNGSNFLSSSSVLVGSVSHAAAYVSASQLTFQLTVAEQATTGRLSVAVVNPVPGGGTSPSATLTLATPTPTPILTQVSPNQFIAGSGQSSVSVSGSNLTSTSVVLWNGSPLVTTYISSSYFGYYLLATVPASLLTSTGTASITVTSPTAVVPVSNALPVTITNPPAPTLTSLSPAAVPINTAASVTLTGTGFTSASTVALNGVSIPAVYTNSTNLTVAIPASSLPLPGNESFTVTTPAPGGGTSAALSLTAFIGIANNSMIYNPANGLFYVSVPSTAGAPYGNSVVSVDPATGTLGTPLFVGSEPNKLAVTSDGRYLWVGLDGASAVRKVDLTTGIAGLQFTLGGNGGIYDNPYQASALAALPGATDSVVVALNSGYGTGLNIYDSGVARTVAMTSYYANPSALLVDGTRNEIYAGLGNSYAVYTYTASSLALKTNVSSGSYANSTFDEMQIAGGRLYTDFGTVYDPESGSLLGTLYKTGTTAASGTTIADSSLGKAFVLDSSSVNYSGSYNQIQIFNTATFNLSGTSVIPVSLAGSTNGPSRLTRWGSNGLAFRTSGGVYSLHSDLVKDLSATSADLGVTLTASGPTATGANTTYTALVTNAGPSTATNVTLTPLLPSTAVLVSAGTPCSAAGTQSCNLGTLASGASISLTYVVTQNTAGSVILTVQVAGSENDPVQTNNQASNTTVVTGSTFALAPSIVSLSPSTVQVGAADTLVTVTGANFTAGSTVLWNGSTLSTTYGSSGKLTATVPAAKLAAMGWGAITVSTPAPGGGISAPTPLTVFQVLTVGVNHLLYDQYDRKLYASVGSGSSTVTGNSIAAITPETGTVGTPVLIGSQPTKMAMSDDGNILYTILGGASSVARFNLLTQQADYSASLTNSNTSYAGSTTGFRDLAVLPGSENTIALDFGYTGGLALVDFTPSTKTAALRGGTGTGVYTGTSTQFLNTQNLLVFNSDTWQTLDKYPVTSTGFGYSSTHTVSTLYNFSAFKLRNNLAYANAGGVADPVPTIAVQLGKYVPLSTYTSTYSQVVEPDVSLSRIFFLTETASTNYGAPDSIVAYDKNSFLPLTTLSLPFATIEGNSTYTGVDLIRWGQDGLAALTSGGHIYLLRGPVVVPQELNTNTAAVITGSSASTLAHGGGNVTLTLTGSNFIPGVAVTWNSSYRTTTIIDATHITVAIPSADLTAAGTASVVANNPGAPASSTLTVTIN